ncbi:MAG: RHS repeat-associated core domain-containing protein [Lentisphaerae bacterium]|nr:RHS repeat-associated core domain-containing protein [Lentisphaerota bacterium]
MSTHTFAYTGLLLDTETIVSSAGTNVIDRSYDSYGRSTGFGLGSDCQVAYGYDAFGRLNQISNFQFQASYSYLANSDLISGYSDSASGLQVTRTYEANRNLLTQIKNQVDSETLSQFDYANDAGGRRTSVKHSGSAFETGPAFNLYDYNSRSEVTVGDRFWGANLNDTSDPVTGQGFAYMYDNIGNRTSSSRDNEESIYTANNLNQYSQRTVADLIDIIGSAETNITVTVNDLPTTRHEKYWHRGLDVTNDFSAVWQEINVIGVYNPPGTNDPDIVSSETGHVFVAKTPETFNYDDDGNLLSDGRFNYSWDAENRLIGAETLTNLPSSVPRVKLEFAYDYMSRRVGKKVYAWNATSNEFQLSSISSFLYDSWNMIQEIDHSPFHRIADSFIWGLDLSRSLQGAGGVGGLLARYRSVTRFYDDNGKLVVCHRPPGNPENRKTIRINESAWPAHQAHGDTLGACDGSSISNSAFLYIYDGNGNVSELLLSSVVSPQLSVAAHYEYSPFGELIVATGPEAFDNVWRFSTKYYDEETALVMYQLRPYSPNLGRWLARDPIGEKAIVLLNKAVTSAIRNQFKSLNTDWNPLNLSQAFHNDPVNRIDLNGMIDHGAWHSNITDGGPDEQDVIDVWYTASQEEANCCKKAKVRRSATWIHIPDGSGSEELLPGDIHIYDQPGDTRAGHYPYPWPYTLRFNYYLPCTEGANKGKDLSSDTRTFRIDGRDITEVQ